MKVAKLKGGKASNLVDLNVFSAEKHIFPCVIDGKDNRIMADVVDHDIPFLISKKEMKDRAFNLRTLHSWT